MKKIITIGLLITCFGAMAAGSKTIRVAVIDTGLDLNDPRFSGVLCSKGHVDLSGSGIVDTYGHGTHVAGIIKEYAGKANYCLIIIKYYREDVEGAVNSERMIDGIAWAIAQHADIINVSGGGTGKEDRELTILKQSPDVKLVGAAGNNGKNELFYPCAYGLPNTRCVGNLGISGERNATSNYGEWVAVWERGEKVWSTLPGGKEGALTGTSQAAAVYTGKLVAGLVRW